jgi:hypothetical protein
MKHLQDILGTEAGGFSEILMMVYNTQKYWVSGHCPSSRILNTRKHSVG